ncbi:hypothetical protein ONZ45_g12443 [Pleurotus djamor]|nr:hypothetical protein ONZ45_g12443 [Pleurotus djamor]
MSNSPKAVPDPKHEGEPRFQIPPTLHGPTINIGQSSIPIPSDPPHSISEATVLHSRIIEVKDRWGVSYRDAAYILFLVTADVANERRKLGEAFRVHRQNIEAATSLLFADDSSNQSDKDGFTEEFDCSTFYPPPYIEFAKSNKTDWILLIASLIRTTVSMRSHAAPSLFSMVRSRGRPRLYHTPEEQQAANRSKSNRSYEKHKVLVNTRRTVRYRHARESQNATTVAEWMAQFNAINERFKQLKNGTVRSYVDGLCHKYLSVSGCSYELFEEALLAVGSFDKTTDDCHAAILQLAGAGSELRVVKPNGLIHPMESVPIDPQVMRHTFHSMRTHAHFPQSGGGLSARAFPQHVTTSVDFESLEPYCNNGDGKNDRRFYSSLHLLAATTIASIRPGNAEPTAASRKLQFLAEFQSSLLHKHAPDLGRYYRSTLDAVVEHHPHLKRNFKRSDFASLTVNFGPQTVCQKHRDVCNLAWGWCAITALGEYDHLKGGHLVLWDLELVIEFPPGYTVLIPSASLYHSNTPISSHETRYSITQYTGGELFRWVDNGFLMEKDVPPATAEERKQRWRDGLAMYETW